MLNLTLVRTFIAIAETGSFVEAARQLGLAQSTVSLQLQRLEDTLGTSLVQRSHSRCTLTLRGQNVLPYARSLLRSAEQLMLAAKGTNITVGCSGNIAAYYISAELRQFLKALDFDATWECKVAPNPEIAELLESGAIDFAAMEWPPQQYDFDVYPWRREAMVVIVPRDHSLAKSRTLSVKQLLELDLIGGEPGSGTGTLLREVLGKRADKLKISHNLQSTEAVKSAVEAGLGCSIVLEGSIRSDPKDKRFSVLKLRDAKLEKLLYVAVQSGLPSSALPRKLASTMLGKSNIGARG